MKERILQFIEYKRLSKNKFYKETGLSNGILDKQGGISSDSLEKIYCVYPEINLDWLLTGKGEMLKKEGLVQQAHNNISSTITQHQTIHAPEDYETLKKENQRLTQENSGLKDKIIQLMEEKMSK
ncbi:transcriptional regulator [Capnocytophaga sp. oral taxon 878]|uniref:transcriptional regulator n=1 Tax=Capnocytophaga sp. oral taxon 878 TaxID=1316596 RepID=UPI000D039700|nr:transcriptional regulator [Capnocytophaga sp. oral taxon 878]AVM49332.1 transcriptional regulator [Capnocytophaga sp. oral taxon 878]